MEVISFDANLEVFNIPIFAIKSGTYLDSYIRFNGKRDIREIKSNDDSIMVYHLDIADENPIEFRSFLTFLLGGEFEWNEEISIFFEKMGYPNKYNFPLDYWKIKLQDNWIRDNFYGLELWNENSKLSPLLIKRGPYVGLVNYTKEFSGGNFISTYDPIKILNQDNIFGYDRVISKNYIIAGGYLISIAFDYPRNSKDIDYFVVTNDEKKANKTVKDILMRYPGVTLITNNAITIKTSNYDRQVILRLYICPSEVVHGFDLDASGILYNGLDIYVTKRCLYSLTTKTNFFDFDRMSESYMYRLAKYASRGFKTWLPGLENYSPNLEKFKNYRYRQDEGQKGKKMDYYDRKSYADIVSEGFKPFGFKKFKEQIDKIYNSVFKDKNSNPIDWIIFATKFKYIPSFLSISDYQKIKEGNKNVTIMYSREEEYIKLPQESISEDEDEDNFISRDQRVVTYRIIQFLTENIEDMGYVNVGPGYIKLPSYMASDIDIFNLDDILYEISGLSKNLNWKKQNPMEQLSGTFNPTKLLNLDKLFSTSVLLVRKS